MPKPGTDALTQSLHEVARDRCVTGHYSSEWPGGYEAFTRLVRAFIVRFVEVAETTLEIKNRLGLHLRAASTLAQALRQFSSAVTLRKGGQEVNARSVTSLMMLGAGQGTKLKARAEGDDAQEALSTLKSLFDSRFGED
jgi:phosphocarrier protein HPr